LNSSLYYCKAVGLIREIRVSDGLTPAIILIA
jgi:hypothetical protein